jgi:5'-nucleotidase
VVAPEADRSGASNSLTLDRPLYVRRSSQGFYYVNGTPTDCVHVAVTGFLDHRPDLVVSGINNSANLAEDTLYSGTVAAAMEGYLLGLPAIAFSLASRSFEHLETAVAVAQQVVRRLIDQPFAKARLLNVNIPAVPINELQGYELTRLGRRHVAQPVETAVSPRGETVYWVGPPGGQREAGPGTDFHALNQSRVSVTPLQVDLGDTDGFQEVGPWLEKM